MDLIDSDGENEQECVKNRSDSLNPTALQSYERPTISPQQNHIHSAAGPPEGDGGSRAKTETLCPSGPKDEGEGEESEREETESSDDHTTQYSIHPPHDCPYLLLLQGCSPAQVQCAQYFTRPSTIRRHDTNAGDGVRRNAQRLEAAEANKQQHLRAKLRGFAAY